MSAARWIAVGLLAFSAGGCAIDSIPLPDVRPDDGRSETDAPEGEGQVGDPSDPGAGDATSGADADSTANQADEDVYDGDTAPALDATRLCYAADAALGTVLLVGTPAAAPGPGTVFVENENDVAWAGASAASLADGSFNVSAQGVLGDRLQILFEHATTQYSPVLLPLSAPSAKASAASLELNQTPYDAGGASSLDDLPEVTTPGVVVFEPIGGWVAVTGGPGTLSEGLAVVVANRDAGGGSLGTVDAAGRFAATLAGASGDELSLFVVEPGLCSGGSPLLTWVP